MMLSPFTSGVTVLVEYLSFTCFVFLRHAYLYEHQILFYALITYDVHIRHRMDGCGIWD